MKSLIKKNANLYTFLKSSYYKSIFAFISKLQSIVFITFYLTFLSEWWFAYITVVLRWAI